MNERANPHSRLANWRRWLFGGAWLALVLGFSGCDDQADRHYYAFLRGDEDGSTDAQRRAHIDRAIELAPGRARYFESRAGERLHGHDSVGALSDLDRAIVLRDRPYLRYLRAIAFCQNGEHKRALADFDRAIASQPGNTQFYRERALARIVVGRAREALADGRRMVIDAPNWPASYFVRGSALAALGRDAEAIADFDEALRRQPALVFVRLARARSRERRGDIKGALRDNTEAARLVPLRHPSELDPWHR